MIHNHISDRPTYSEENWHIIERAQIKACELLGQPPATYAHADRLARTIMRLFAQGSRNFQILAADSHGRKFGESGMSKLKARTKTAQKPANVTDQILHDILAGTLAPGVWLKQIDLEQRYQSTWPEVRRPLDRLVQKRLVEHVPNRGYHVFEPDGRQATEVSDIRVILETAVADRIVANSSELAVKKLRDLAHRFDDLIMNGTMIELYEANLAFHHELLALCGNRELVNLITEIRQRTSSAPVSQWKTRARIEQSSREHHEMIEALAAGDIEELKRVTVKHIKQM